MTWIRAVLDPLVFLDTRGATGQQRPSTPIRAPQPLCTALVSLRIDSQPLDSGAQRAPGTRALDPTSSSKPKERTLRLVQSTAGLVAVSEEFVLRYARE